MVRRALSRLTEGETLDQRPTARSRARASVGRAGASRHGRVRPSRVPEPASPNNEFSQAAHQVLTRVRLRAKLWNEAFAPSNAVGQASSESLQRSHRHHSLTEQIEQHQSVQTRASSRARIHLGRIAGGDRDHLAHRLDGAHCDSASSAASAFHRVSFQSTPTQHGVRLVLLRSRRLIHRRRH